MFRFKITLFSVLTSGTVLVVFGLFFLGVISTIELKRIDREVLTLGESQLHIWHSLEHWNNFDQSLRSIYGEDHWKSLIVQVTDAHHQVLYKSPQWPEQISAEAFPGFDSEMAIDSGAPPPHRLPPHPEGSNSFRENDPTYQPDEESNRRRPPPPPLYTSAPNQMRPQPPPPGQMLIKTPIFKTLKANTDSWRIGIMGNQHITILFGRNMNTYYEDARRYKNIFLLSVPLALLFIATGGWWLAHRALKPIVQITRTAEMITAKGLDRRIPERKADSEFLQLIKVINDMLFRLEKSYNQAVRFSGDAAHELQTPLTIIQAMLDDGVQHTENGSGEQQRYNDLLEEVQRLKVIVQKLLILSRADAGQLARHTKPLDFSELIETIIEDVTVLAPHLTIEQEIPTGIMVKGDRELIRQVVQNLAFNAIKYNLDKGLIRFQLSQTAKNILFRISNTGQTIPKSERKKIFKRFYRIDKSRSDKTAGSGLGLALAVEIARAHGGNLMIEPTDDNLNMFVLTLPRFQ